MHLAQEFTVDQKRKEVRDESDMSTKFTLFRELTF